MRTSSLAMLVLAALSMTAGCLGNRPEGSTDGGDGGGGGGGAGGSGGGAKGSVGGYGGTAVDAGAHDSSSGGVPGAGGINGAGGADAGVGPGMGGATGYGGAGGGGQAGSGDAGMGGRGGAAGGGMGGAAGAGMGGAGGVGVGGQSMGGSSMGGASMGGSGMGGASMGGSGMGGATGAGGMVVIAAALSGTTSKDFSSLSLGTASASFTWPISNATGAMSTGALTLTNPDPSEVTATGCTGSLAGGASCNVTVTFRPNLLGARNTTLTMSASPGGSVTLTLSATGTAQITVTTVGTGTVTSAPAGISCPGTCTGTFTTAAVTLQARTTNGSNSFFSGWSDAACPGPFHDCAKSLTTASTAITAATFSAMNANLIFGTSATFATNLGATAPGGTASYDAACNTVATGAGLNNAAGNAYIAMISDANSNGTARLGTARGWVRMDGKPFADTLAGILMSNQIFYPFVFQDDGKAHNGDSYLTAMNFDGTTASQNCTNWTDATINTSVLIGAGSGTTGPGWLDTGSVFCGFIGPLICMGKSKSVAVTVPTPGAGRKIWSTSTLFTPGTTTTPNALCQSALPSGVTSAAALISTTTTPASSVLVPATAYYRLDGVFVGTGSDITAMGGSSNTITSGVWQSQDGAYVLFNSNVWTGSTGVSQPGTTASTCGDWTDSTQPSGTYGSAVSSTSRFWGNSTATCALAGRLFCVQTAP